MATPEAADALTYAEVALAASTVQLRVESAGNITALFADANIYTGLLPLKNQVIYGLRGTGKTHLVGRLGEHYRDTLAESKILPIYVDTTSVAHVTVMGEELRALDRALTRADGVLRLGASWPHLPKSCDAPDSFALSQATRDKREDGTGQP